MSANAGLYIHIPFCSAICPYCDFAVRKNAPAARARFLTALLDEIKLWGEHWRLPLDTIYLGGGTPSLMGRAELTDMVAAVTEWLPVTAAPRLFLEANPEDVNDANLSLWHQLGVRYLSLGVQSLDDGELGFLGRRHSALQAAQALATSVVAGFDTVSADVIFGLPEQTETTLVSTLEKLIDIGPQHISGYQLTVHEGTAFGRRHQRGQLAPLSEDAQAHCFELVHQRLADAGYGAYEVSNFALCSKHRSAHNMKYWAHVPYLGLGPSAHSFDGRRRWWNKRGLPAYQRALTRGWPIAETEVLTDEQLALEALMLRLRTAQGIVVADFHRRYGIELMAKNSALCEALAAEGLVSLESGSILPTRRGLAVADGIAARFMLA